MDKTLFALEEARSDVGRAQEELGQAESQFEVGRQKEGWLPGLSADLRSAAGRLRQARQSLEGVKLKDGDRAAGLDWVRQELAGFRLALLGAAEALDEARASGLADSRLVLRRARAALGPTYYALKHCVTQEGYEASVRSAERSAKPPRGRAATRRGGGGASAPPSPVRVGETIEEFAALVLRRAAELATEAPEDGPQRFGDAVFVASLWKRFFESEPLDEFKARLLEANRLRLLSLKRADLVEVMDKDAVQLSEIKYLGDSFHFVELREAPAAPPPEREDLPAFAARVNSEVDRILRDGLPPRAFDGAVYISGLWRESFPGLSLVDFKRLLLSANRLRMVDLARYDMVEWADPGELQLSETKLYGAIFNLVRQRAAVEGQSQADLKLAAEPADEFSLRIHDKVRALVRAGGPAVVGGRGTRARIWINHLHRALDDGSTLEAFKARLLRARREGVVELARADLVSIYPADDVRESETRGVSDLPMGFVNFVVDPRRPFLSPEGSE